MKAPEPFDELIERVGEARFAKKKLPIPVAVWREAVGPRIADRARPVVIERGILTILVATSVWANELQMLSKEIVERIKTRGIHITGVRFRVGSMDPVDRPPDRRALRRVPPPKPLPADIRTEVAKVKDLELRSILAQAAGAALAWQEFNSTSSSSRRPAAPDLSGAKPVARAPRDVGRGNVPPDRRPEASDEASPRSSSTERDRRR